MDLDTHFVLRAMTPGSFYSPVRSQTLGDSLVMKLFYTLYTLSTKCSHGLLKPYDDSWQFASTLLWKLPPAFHIVSASYTYFTRRKCNIKNDGDLKIEFRLKTWKGFNVEAKYLYDF